MNRKKRVGLASIGLGITVALYQFAPSLAENISQSLAGSMSETSTTFIDVETSVVLMESSTSLTTEDSSVALTDSKVTAVTDNEETETVETRVRRLPPPELTSTQGITVRIPDTVRVDPRAQGAFLPRIFAESLNSLMVCARSDSLEIDIGTQGLVDAIDTDSLKVSGDRSGNLVLSGDPQTVIGLINGALGMRVYRSSGGVANQSVSIVLADLSRPSSDSGFCERSSGGNRRTITFMPLALEQRISDGKVRLGK